MKNLDKSYPPVFDNCAALGFQSSNEDLKELMRLLALPMSHYESALFILQQGRWRVIADNPIRYVRAAARRKHRTIERAKSSPALVGCISELIIPRNKDGTQMSYDDTIDLVNAEPLEGDWEDDYAKQRLKPEFLIAESQSQDAHYKVDYSKLMDRVASLA